MPLAENYLSHITPKAVEDFPLHWQVIYQEAAHGNHMIFANEDILRFQFKFPDQLHHQDFDMVPVVLKFFKMSSIPEIRSYIAGLSFNEREFLFGFYLNYLNDLKTHVKSLLN